MLYVRWRRGENRRRRVFPPLDRDHPSYWHPCAFCPRRLGDDRSVQLIAVGPEPDTDKETIEKAAGGRWFTAAAVLAHAACVAMSDDAAIESVISELIPMSDEDARVTDRTALRNAAGSAGDAS